MSAEEKELLHLLTSPHLKVDKRGVGVSGGGAQRVCSVSQAVLSVHDTVAQKNFDPVLPPLPDDFEDELEEESVKIVRLVKNKEPLVREEEEEGGGGLMFASVLTTVCRRFRAPPSGGTTPPAP